MSTAQAVTSGVSSPSAGARSQGSGPADRGDAFRETLETASRSGGAHKGDRVEGESASDREMHGERGTSDQGRGADELAQMLAELGAAPVSGASVGGAGMAVPQSGAGYAEARGGQDEEMPSMPGIVQDGESPLDTEQLHAALKSGAALPVAEEAPITVKARVTRQETHLAFGGPSSSAQATANAGEDAESFLSRAAQVTEEGPLARGGVASAQTGAAGTSRGAPIVEDWGRSAAYTEPGIGGQDARQSDGRGSSGAGSQQQGSGAFMAMFAGGPVQAARGVGEADDAAILYDPVSDQIADHVRAELRADGVGEVSSDGVVKVLELELKPANMGAVTVRLALKDNVISIHLEAQRLDTLAVIERERDALAGALASAGYSVDGITAAPQSDANRSVVSLVSQSDAGASASQGGAQGQFGQNQGLGHSSGGQGRSGDTGSRAPTYPGSSGDKDNGGAAIRRESGGIYV